MIKTEIPFELSTFLALLALAFIAGGVNFSILSLKLLKNEDPRQSGSKNPGVSNVARIAGKPVAALVLLLDLAKSAAIALLSIWALPLSELLWPLWLLLLGNRFPVFHGFQGGKGVANLLGFTLFAAWPFALIGMVLWVAVYQWQKETFLASFAMSFALIIGLLLRGEGGASSIVAAFAIMLLIAFTHQSNIRKFREKRARKEER